MLFIYLNNIKTELIGKYFPQIQMQLLYLNIILTILVG